MKDFLITFLNYLLGFLSAFGISLITMLLHIK